MCKPFFPTKTSSKPAFVGSSSRFVLFFRFSVFLPYSLSLWLGNPLSFPSKIPRSMIRMGSAHILGLHRLCSNHLQGQWYAMVLWMRNPNHQLATVHALFFPARKTIPASSERSLWVHSLCFFPGPGASDLACNSIT